jgi:chromosome partitioning protein
MIISIGSQKGGVGKTTTSLALAAGLAHAGKKVLLIDIDYQANSSKVLLPDYQKLDMMDTVCATVLERKPLTIHKTSIPHLDIVPSHILLSNADLTLITALDNRAYRLKTQLDKVRSEWDYIFIDCPPSIGWLTLNAFTASDKIIIVVSPGYFELDSIVQINKTIEKVKEEFNPSLDLFGMLFNLSENTNATVASLQLLRQTYPNKVFRTIIPRNTDIKEAQLSKQGIFSFNNRANAAIAYKKLIQEIFGYE